MCGRLSLGVNKNVLENYYHSKLTGKWEPIYNAAPSQYLPIVQNTNQEKISLAQWGFLPKWMQDKRPQGFINTRSETVFEKPSFKKAILERRCLVPADGFFEWQQGVKKQPYYFQLKKGGLFSLAGIWESWTDDDNHEILTYSILTTMPNEMMSPIHDRMPVILNRTEEAKWLTAKSKNDIESMMHPYPAAEMMCFPISTAVNSPGNNSSAILKPIKL